MQIKRFFFDTEFIEDGKTIDLISIGIVSEDGREYYACNKECDLSRASEWVQDNVIVHLPGSSSPEWIFRQQIATEIVAFVFGDADGQTQTMIGELEIEFWADYASYDWVALCQLFGTMIDLPTGFPMFCHDIQQLKRSIGFTGSLPEIPSERQHNALADAHNCMERYQFLMQQKSQVKFLDNQA